TCRQYDLPRLYAAPCAADAEAVGILLDGFDTARVLKLHARLPRGVEQGVEDGASAVGGGEQLARVLALEFDPDLAEEGDSPRDIEAAQDFFDGVARGSGVGAFVNAVMGDVAAPAARDKDFRAQLGG